MAQSMAEFAASAGQWAGVNEMIIKGLNSKGRFDLHAMASLLGLFTMSKGIGKDRVLHVFRTKPVDWVPHVPKPKHLSMSLLREFVPEVFKNDLWAGGGREFIGDCEDCGVELWGYDDERGEEDEDNGGSGLCCKQCGGDTLSKFDLMR